MKRSIYKQLIWVFAIAGVFGLAAVTETHRQGGVVFGQSGGQALTDCGGSGECSGCPACPGKEMEEGDDCEPGEFDFDPCKDCVDGKVEFVESPSVTNFPCRQCIGGVFIDEEGQPCQVGETEIKWECKEEGPLEIPFSPSDATVSLGESITIQFPYVSYDNAKGEKFERSLEGVKANDFIEQMCYCHEHWNDWESVDIFQDFSEVSREWAIASQSNGDYHGSWITNVGGENAAVSYEPTKSDLATYQEMSWWAYLWGTYEKPSITLRYTATYTPSSFDGACSEQTETGTVTITAEPGECDPGAVIEGGTFTQHTPAGVSPGDISWSLDALQGILNATSGLSKLSDAANPSQVTSLVAGQVQTIWDALSLPAPQANVGALTDMIMDVTLGPSDPMSQVMDVVVNFIAQLETNSYSVWLMSEFQICNCDNGWVTVVVDPFPIENSGFPEYGPMGIWGATTFGHPSSTVMQNARSDYQSIIQNAIADETASIDCD